MPILPSHARIVLVTEKTLILYRLSSQVLLHPKLGSNELKYGLGF